MKIPRNEGELKGMHRGQRGFSLLELSIALVVIAILVGITMIGIDVYRNAVMVRIYNDFVQGWQAAFSTYVARSGGILPGDNPTNPTGYVNAALDTPLCDDSIAAPLSVTMLQFGVSLPSGRGPGLAARYVYEDKAGLPHELRVCLVSTNWSVQLVAQGSNVATYQSVPKTVLRIYGVTPDLARQLNSMIDGRVDAGLGNLRESQFDTLGRSTDWSANAAQSNQGNTTPEAQSVELTADLLLQ
ncbi:type II secretion system GspH family protein [Burkholderia seminalis]|uniref:type II secretion system protein n=1 Tax=Burkholderia seminalis TaxID=488731 RepID=UPI001CF5724D|nr:type II secretion system protein [Burkholderia seminalis]MCA7955592.1 type II secretion system GspH family protein [Burkholderia seminalis]